MRLGGKAVGVDMRGGGAGVTVRGVKDCPSQGVGWDGGVGWGVGGWGVVGCHGGLWGRVWVA